MTNPETDILFPPRIIPDLSGLRGQPWRDLVERVLSAPPSAPDKTAFVLLMARLNNCATCTGDAYRALQGCTLCSQQTLTRRKESDDELVNLFQIARADVLAV